MAKGKVTADSSEGEKELPPVRIPPQLQAAVRKACEILVENTTEFVKGAVREKLERMNLWPLEAEKKAEDQ